MLLVAIWLDWERSGSVVECLTRDLKYAGLSLIGVSASADPEGGGRTGGSDPPPGKSQVIWVSIGNKQLDPPWKMLDHVWNLEKLYISLKLTI